MSCLHYHDGTLFIENMNLAAIAEEYGTPCYVYSKAAIETNWKLFDFSFDHISHLICYAVKANSNIAILHLLAKLGSGFDIVSLGELERVLKAKGDPQKIIFSGVGKSERDIIAAIKANIYCFNIESEAEMQRLSSLAKEMRKKVNVAIRVNPNVEADTHAHIVTGAQDNKFGVEIEKVIPLAESIRKTDSLNLTGIACHIGSQITNLDPFIESLDLLFELYDQLKALKFNLDHIDVGGGLGITYHEEKPPAIHDYVKALEDKIADYPVKIIVEPGRAIVGNAGVLLTKVEYIKQTANKHFAIVDAGMNDLIRPALYDAWQKILPVTMRDDKPIAYDIAGPVCESADFLGKNRRLSIHCGDLLAIDTAGAYSFSMSSNYNSRCRPAEVLIDRNHAHLIRKREAIKELFADECLV